MRDELIKGLRELNKESERLYRFSSDEFKGFIKQVINLFDNIASFIIHERTTLERDYLTISRSPIISDRNVEEDFYNIYFYFKNMLNKSIKRVDKEKLVVKGRKHTEVITNDDLNKLFSRIKTVAERIVLF